MLLGTEGFLCDNDLFQFSVFDEEYRFLPFPGGILVSCMCRPSVDVIGTTLTLTWCVRALR